MNALIIGYGSIGRRHYTILKNFFECVDVVTSQNIAGAYNSIDKTDLDKYDYFVISNETHKHFKTLKTLDQKVRNKKILVEKPLFHQYYEYTPKNRVFVAYNLRFHPLIDYLKKHIKNPVFAEVKCGSYLPEWRESDYRNSYSSKKEGGGVIRDLSHELDYFYYLFGKIKDIKYFTGKISSLEIESEDMFTAVCKNDILMGNITLDYISKIPRREIFIHTDTATIKADLMKNTLNINNEIIDFENIERNYTYEKMHKNIIFENGNKACSYDEGLETVKLIQRIYSDVM